MSWNYGDILDAVGAVVPAEKPCLIHDAMDDTQVVSWGDFNRRTNNLARRFLNRHAQATDKVAFYHAQSSRVPRRRSVRASRRA